MNRFLQKEEKFEVQKKLFIYDIFIGFRHFTLFEISLKTWLVHFLRSDCLNRSELVVGFLTQLGENTFKEIL